MVDLAEADRRIVAISAAMPEGTGLADFRKQFPDRCFDVGNAEQHAATFAAGLAAEGLKPVVAIYSTFLQRAYDQILHDVCIESLPVVFAIDRGGLVGEDGATHHGLFDLSYLRSLPNMIVAAPKDEDELRRLLKTGLDCDGPFAFRYPRGQATGARMDNSFDALSPGRAEVLEKGADIVLLAIGACVSEALSAHRKLGKMGIGATVVNARFAKPLDRECFCELAERILFVVTVEENVLAGGLGSAVLECFADAGLTGVAVKRIGIPDAFVEHGPQSLLRTKYGFDSDSVVRAALNLLNSADRPSPRKPIIAHL